MGDAVDFGSPFAVEVTEVVHDPELDEAVISFANADFAQCEEALQRITAPDGDRGQHAETWLVLFDLYRATGQQQRFESLAVEYAQPVSYTHLDVYKRQTRDQDRRETSCPPGTCRQA